jgi:hypothetical protein
VLEILPHQRQSGIRLQVVGQTFDLKVGHGGSGRLSTTIILGPPAGFTLRVRDTHLQPVLAFVFG